MRGRIIHGVINRLVFDNYNTSNQEFIQKYCCILKQSSIKHLNLQFKDVIAIKTITESLPDTITKINLSFGESCVIVDIHVNAIFSIFNKYPLLEYFNINIFNNNDIFDIFISSLSNGHKSLKSLQFFDSTWNKKDKYNCDQYIKSIIEILLKCPQLNEVWIICDFSEEALQYLHTEVSKITKITDFMFS